jgi:hypothetical protein
MTFRAHILWLGRISALRFCRLNGSVAQQSDSRMLPLFLQASRGHEHPTRKRSNCPTWMFEPKTLLELYKAPHCNVCKLNVAKLRLVIFSRMALQQVAQCLKDHPTLQTFWTLTSALRMRSNFVPLLKRYKKTRRSKHWGFRRTIWLTTLDFLLLLTTPWSICSSRLLVLCTKSALVDSLGQVTHKQFSHEAYELLKWRTFG